MVKVVFIFNFEEGFCYGVIILGTYRYSLEVNVSEVVSHALKSRINTAMALRSPSPVVKTIRYRQQRETEHRDRQCKSCPCEGVVKLFELRL